MNTTTNILTSTNQESTAPALPTAPPATPETRRGDRRHANIDRLPKATRDMINILLGDGLPYHLLLEELGEAGQGLKAQSLTDWVRGRFQDYLKNRQDIERAKSQTEFAAELIRELEDTDPSLLYRACVVVAAHQIFKAILEHGDEALREMLRGAPTTYLNLLNTVWNLRDAELKREQQKLGN